MHGYLPGVMGGSGLKAPMSCKTRNSLRILSKAGHPAIAAKVEWPCEEKKMENIISLQLMHLEQGSQPS